MTLMPLVAAGFDQDMIWLVAPQRAAVGRSIRSDGWSRILVDVWATGGRMMYAEFSRLTEHAQKHPPQLTCTRPLSNLRLPRG